MYQPAIGLEIHVQLLTRTKVFCACPANFGDEPNSNVCPVCLGYPGVLPALNAEAIEMGYTVARALNCDLAPVCRFDRKNYFYPDLPKNYQITQFAQPLGTNGYLEIVHRGKVRRVRIAEIHLEEDAGRLIHAGDVSLVDYNRGGTPLLEIVTEPDIEIGDEAEALLLELRRIVRYLGVCDGNMEEGSLRCDANVSISDTPGVLGNKVEVKNLNSSRFVRRAIAHEIERQAEILDRGGRVTQETRLWNENRDRTEGMRTKERAADYRYFPEPDLPPFVADEAFLGRVEARMVELPAARRARIARDYGLSENQADALCDERVAADYFEATCRHGASPVAVANWLSGDVRKELNRTGLGLDASPLTPERLARILALLEEGRIHGKLAKQLLRAVFDDDDDPDRIVRDRGWEQLVDRGAIAAVVRTVIGENRVAADQIAAGDTKPIGFIVGQVMRATGGRAEPRLVQELIRAALQTSFIRFLSFGGAISGRLRDDGLVEAGEPLSLASVVERAAAAGSETIRLEEVRLGEFLSEDVTPEEWARLVVRVAAAVADGSTRGVVVGHGTDTLPYTAALLHWIFGATTTPIVLTASHASPQQSDEALTHLTAAIALASSSDRGVQVSYGGERFGALNLRFERVGAPGEPDTFRTWNATAVGGAPSGGAAAIARLGGDELTSELERAFRRVAVIRLYPGMAPSILEAVIDAGARHVVLELYDTGTAPTRPSPFSLRPALVSARERDVHVYGTSQQEGRVGFQDYVTSQELWRDGVRPMGVLTTESVVTRLVVAQIEARLDADTRDDDVAIDARVARTMEGLT